MKAEDLVNGKKLIELLVHSKRAHSELWDAGYNEALNYILNQLKSCTLSPAEFDSLLKEKLDGDSWVLKKIKKDVGFWVNYFQQLADGFDGKADSKEVQDLIIWLESQAPRSDIAKEIEQNRKKARAWDKLYQIMITPVSDLIPDSAIDYNKIVKFKMDRLLEEGDEQR